MIRRTRLMRGWPLYHGGALDKPEGEARALFCVLDPKIAGRFAEKAQGRIYALELVKDVQLVHLDRDVFGGLAPEAAAGYRKSLVDANYQLRDEMLANLLKQHTAGMPMDGWRRGEEVLLMNWRAFARVVARYEDTEDFSRRRRAG